MTYDLEDRYSIYWATRQELIFHYFGNKKKHLAKNKTMIFHSLLWNDISFTSLYRCFVNISAEYSLEKKENRCYLRARTSTHRLRSHWHVNRSNMSLYAIHLISLAQPNHGFEPWTNTFVVCYSIRWVS